MNVEVPIFLALLAEEDRARREWVADVPGLDDRTTAHVLWLACCRRSFNLRRNGNGAIGGSCRHGVPYSLMLTFDELVIERAEMYHAFGCSNMRLASRQRRRSSPSMAGTVPTLPRSAL
jgi:hypothetical protein